MKDKRHIHRFNEHKENLNVSDVINRLFNRNTDKVRKKERLKIYNQYKSGGISYDEYVKQRKELEQRYKEEDKRHTHRFNEHKENLNVSDVSSSKKFEVEIKGNDGKVIFFDIIDAENLNDAFDKSTDIVGTENITLHDEVDINIREVK